MEKVCITSIQQASDFFSKLGKSFAFDVETTSTAILQYEKTYGVKAELPENIANQALNYYYLEVYAMSFCDGKQAGYVNFSDVNRDEFLSLVKPYFLEAKNIIGHNIAFDIKALHKHGIDLDGKRIYCTMVADHLLDEEREHGLKKLAHSILGVEETIKYEDARRMGGETLATYAMNDAIWTWQLCMWQQPQLKAQQLEKVFREIEMPFQFCLVEMEINGFAVDLKRAEQISEILKQAKETSITKMLEHLGEQFSIQYKIDGSSEIVSPIDFESSTQLAKLCEGRLKLAKVEETGKGNYSVGKVFLEHYKDHPFVKLLAGYKTISQLYKLFFIPLPKYVCGDGRVRASFKDTGTATGRLSCQRPNLQQLSKPKCWVCGSPDFAKGKCVKCATEEPPQTRSCFVAEEGHTMVTADYSGQEIRVMAQISQDPTLIEALHNGYDLHLTTANKMFKLGIPAEALSEKHPDYDKYKKQFKGQRGKAKTILFGLAYGKGAFGFAQDFNTTEEEAQKIVDDFFGGMPKLKEAIEKSHVEVKKFGYVTYLSGRRRHFTKAIRQNPDGTTWEGYTKKTLRQGFNASVQGFSADMMRLAMIKIRAAAKEHPEYNLKFLATVHDEIVTSCRSEYVKEVSTLIKHSMETAVTFCVPVVAEIGVGRDYAEAK